MLNLFNNFVKSFKTSKNFKYLDNENIIYNNKIIYPTYSTNISFTLFKKTILKILKNPNKKKKIYIERYNILTVALEDFFWQCCFQITKYQKFIKKKGIELKPKLSKKSNVYQIDSYGRVKNYFEGNKNLKNIVKTYFRKTYFFCWIFKNFIFKKKNKIWIDRSFINDFRYGNLSINQNHIVIPYALQSLRKKMYNIQEALIEDAKSKIKNYRFWVFAIKLLKPKKIILRDNLYDNYSLLLAAKVTNTYCEAISHSPTCRFHMNIFGLNIFKSKEVIKFDKIYVYHKIFKDSLTKFGNFYKRSEIKIIRWPNNRKYNFKTKKNNKNIYVLYAFEHFCNFKKINQVLLFLQKKGHKIIIKKRPDMINYGHFDHKLKIEFVKDFKLQHIKNCLCFFGSTTGLIFNLSQNFIPILYLTECGYNHFKGLDYPQNWVKIRKINNEIYNKILRFKIYKNFVL